MAWTLTTTVPVLSRLELLTTDDMTALGEKVIQVIRARTQRGVDETGRPFRPYSDRYRERKERETGPTPVNLSLSGGMLNDLKVRETTNRSVTIGWVR